MLGKMVCALSGHVVDRHRVWFDSMEYRTTCTRCGAEMIRLPAGWTVFEEDKHAHPSRDPHPKGRA